MGTRMMSRRFIDTFRTVLESFADHSYLKFVKNKVVDFPVNIAEIVSDYEPRAAHYLGLLNGTDMKRMIFSAAQMRQFDDTDAPIPDTYRKKLRLPFDLFWMELSEPVALAGLQEPGRNERFTRAFMVHHDSVPRPDKAMRSSRKGFPPSVRITVFTTEGNSDKPAYYTDESFFMELATGRVYGSLASITTGTNDHSIYKPTKTEMKEQRLFPELNDAGFDRVPQYAESQLTPDALSSLTLASSNRIWVYFGERLNQPGRHVGWYEQYCLRVAKLFSWVLAYTMAKGIHIVKLEPVRRERRRAARQGVIPVPWHIVEVKPSISLGTDDTQGSIGRLRHSYRYDVMGHLRFGRHKLADGTFRDTVEWVKAHQRGLKNSLYIPKTYNIGAGKVSHPIMQDYWNQVA